MIEGDREGAAYIAVPTQAMICPVYCGPTNAGPQMFETFYDVEEDLMNAAATIFACNQQRCLDLSDGRIGG